MIEDGGTVVTSVASNSATMDTGKNVIDTSKNFTCIAGEDPDCVPLDPSSAEAIQTAGNERGEL